jgi:very-short-patch-repair endonuclease
LRKDQNIRAAKRLRRNANPPEQKAWDALRTLRQHGVVVRRQHPVGRHVVDFAIVKARIAIEIDGGIHALREVAARDALRQQEIEAGGWRVLRISPEVAMSRDHLLALIQQELGI